MATEGGGGGGNILVWFLGILVFAFFLWYALGGPEWESSRDQFIKLDAQSTERELRAYEREQRSEARPTLMERLRGVNVGDERLREDVHGAGLRGVSSPHSGLISISSDSYPEARSPKDEYIGISADFNNEEDINITGWKLESLVTGNYYIIGTAAELAKSGQVNIQRSIVLPPGAFAYAISGRSAIGTSFRINTCIGYLDQFQSFSPPLPLSCPSPSEEYEIYSDISTKDLVYEEDDYYKCEQFVKGLHQCRMFRDDFDDIEPRIPRLCKQFVTEHFSYNGCLTYHKTDPDFYKNEWRIYGGSRDELWRDRRDIIRLLDTEGRVVDVLTY